MGANILEKKQQLVAERIQLVSAHQYHQAQLNAVSERLIAIRGALELIEELEAKTPKEEVETE